MWIYIIIAVIVFIIIYAFVIFNSFVKLNNKVKEAFSTMDIYLKKRWDLIPNIVEIVKGYAKYENIDGIINAFKKNFKVSKYLVSDFQKKSNHWL